MPMNKRVDWRVEVKSFDDDQRYITGMASTPSVDRMGDIVEPMGATFEREIPLFVDHDSTQRVGRVKLGKPTKKGIPFEAWIVKVNEPGALRDRVDLAWQEVKYGLLQTVSVGFRILNDAVENIASGYRFLQTEILELSLVPIPAQSEARIQYFKSIAASQRAAPGHRAAGSDHQPARAGASNPKGTNVKTYTQESLAALKEARQQKAARMTELQELKGTEQRGFTADERTEFDALDAEIENLDDDIRVTQRHVNNIATARPVDGGGSRAPYGFAKKFNDVEPKFKGEEGLKRLVCQLDSSIRIKNGMGYVPPEVLAEQRFGKTNPTLVAIMKTAVAGGGTDSGEPWAELAAVDNRYSGDFIEFLYGLTVFDRLPLREVPSNVSIKGQDGAFTGYWVGQSKGIPMSQGSASAASTAPLKVAALTVVSNELIRDSSPAALTIIGDSLRQAIAQTVDTKFFSADAASAGVSPAGILNGVSATNTNGGDADSIRTDIKALFAPFITAKNASGFVWVMQSTTALALSLMQNALGQTAFPGVTPQGGTFLGYPVYVGDNVGSGDVILLQPREIWKIGDLGVQFSTSTEAMIEQATDPAGATDTPVAAANYMTSMFQEESTAIKVVRPINFGKRRASAVAYVGDAAWGSENS